MNSSMLFAVVFLSVLTTSMAEAANKITINGRTVESDAPGLGAKYDSRGFRAHEIYESPSDNDESSYRRPDIHDRRMRDLEDRDREADDLEYQAFRKRLEKFRRDNREADRARLPTRRNSSVQTCIDGVCQESTCNGHMIVRNNVRICEEDAQKNERRQFDQYDRYSYPQDDDASGASR
jgi:hypothetical protein